MDELTPANRRQAALDYLRSHQVLTLATYGPDGLWAAAVFYVSQNFDLFFLSAPHTRHSQNIATHPHVAGTIQEDYQDWTRIQGIQLEGEIQLLSGVRRTEAITLYQQKFPFVAQEDNQLKDALQKVNWYHLRPDQLFFIDNRFGLGHRDKIELAA